MTDKQQTWDSDRMVYFNPASSLKEQLTKSNLKHTTFTASVALTCTSQLCQ